MSSTDSDDVRHERLLRAALQNDARGVERQLDLGACVDFQDLERWTALHFAVQYLAIDAARVLLRRGADPNGRAVWEWTPLIRAAQLHNTRAKQALLIIRLLLEHGADLTLVDSSGWTVLHHAVHADNSLCVNALLVLGAGPNLRVSCVCDMDPPRATPLQLARCARLSFDTTAPRRDISANAAAEIERYLVGPLACIGMRSALIPLCVGLADLDLPALVLIRIHAFLRTLNDTNFAVYSTLTEWTICKIVQDYIKNVSSVEGPQPGGPLERTNELADSAGS